MKVSKEQWAEIRIRYERNERVSDLASEYGISPGSITNRASRYGWDRKINKASFLSDGALQAIELADKDELEPLRSKLHYEIDRKIDSHLAVKTLDQRALILQSKMIDDVMRDYESGGCNYKEVCTYLRMAGLSVTDIAKRIDNQPVDINDIPPLRIELIGDDDDDEI